MTDPLYCSQYHENPSGSRFCRFCGEALTEPATGSDPSAQTILGMRYRVLHLLGQGGFGRTYLAEDLNRFEEKCVLKEFVPLVHDADALRKAEELFQREAGVLYQLQHDQIPRFRELLRVGQDQEATLYLVQDYIPGSTYREILQQRQREKRTFTEDEILDLFRQLLPVLQYLHNLRVIHRDIAPDNLILRDTDNLPVLIDFGGVKQIAAQVEQQLRSHAHAAAPTRLGKAGYAPDEQMQSGEVTPSSDLYALAVTALVLLTGQEPLSLYDPHTVTWHWRRLVQVSPRLSQVLDRMLAFRPSDRYSSAMNVMQALGWPATANGVESPARSIPPLPVPAPAPATSSSMTGQATVAVSPRAPRQVRQAAVKAKPRKPKAKSKSRSQADPLHSVVYSSGGSLAAIAPNSGLRSRPQRRIAPSSRAIGQVILFVLLLTGTAWSIWLVWWLVTAWEPTSSLFTPPVAVSSDPPDQPTPSPSAEPETNEPTYSPAERARKAELRQRREQLEVSEGILNTITNQLFFRQYPEKEGVQLTSSAADEVWRKRWDDTATDALKQIDDALSSEARQSLGSYDSSDRDQWEAEARTDHNVSGRALYDLTDAAFKERFPDFADELANGALLDTPMGQVWHGMAFDRLRGFRDGDALEDIKLDDKDDRTVERELRPGEGKVYTVELSDEQDLKVRLDAPDDEALLSIYPPRLEEADPLQEDSDDYDWSGDLSQSGVYEIVVVSRSDDAFDYKLRVEVDK
ncbi:MAG: protein kinase domain-containing protein [Thainema sp.]